jgi:hypothetical protein
MYRFISNNDFADLVALLMQKCFSFEIKYIACEGLTL